MMDLAGLLPQIDVPHLLGVWGYLAVGLIVGLESIGVPLPGETTLLAAAVLAGAEPRAAHRPGDRCGRCRRHDRRQYRLLDRPAPRLSAPAALRPRAPHPRGRDQGRALSLPAPRRQGCFLRPLRRGVARAGSAAGRHQPDGLAPVRRVQRGGCGGLGRRLRHHRLSPGRRGEPCERLRAHTGPRRRRVAIVLGYFFSRRHYHFLRDAAERAFPGPLLPPEAEAGAGGGGAR